MSIQEQGSNRVHKKTLERESLLYLYGSDMPIYKIILDEPLKGTSIELLLLTDDELFVSRSLGQVTNFGEGINFMRKPMLGSSQQIGDLQTAKDSTSNRWYIIDSLGHPISPGFDEEITLTNQEDVYGITLRGKRSVLAKLQPEAQKIIGERLQRLREGL